MALKSHLCGCLPCRDRNLPMHTVRTFCPSNRNKNTNMDVQSLQINPFRRPTWRADRAMLLIENRRVPIRSDDRHIRMYWRFLHDASAAPEDERRLQSAEQVGTDIFRAHQFHFHPDPEWRHLLEARLLTREPFQAIAQRFDMPASTIKCYEHLFFNVCDQLDCRDWIIKIIKGESGGSDCNWQGVMTEELRGKVYKMFAYHGGPVVLDALLASLSPNIQIATSITNSAAWFDETLKEAIRCTAAEAFCALEIGQSNLMPMLKLGLDQQRAAAGNHTRHDSTSMDPARNIEVFLAQFSSTPG
jgi:hypothetical protein